MKLDDWIIIIIIIIIMKLDNRSSQASTRVIMHRWQLACNPSPPLPYPPLPSPPQYLRSKQGTPSAMNDIMIPLLPVSLVSWRHHARVRPIINLYFVWLTYPSTKSLGHLPPLRIQYLPEGQAPLPSSAVFVQNSCSTPRKTKYMLTT
jgi:hypothetical protein